MNFSIITAMDISNNIGISNKLPWNLPNEMKWFRKNTVNKPCIMGSSTFKSIKKPLPERLNIILTRDKFINCGKCLVFSSLEELLDFDLLKKYPELMVIGGENIYNQFLPLINKIYLTTIYDNFEGDKKFPLIDFKEWNQIDSSEHFENNTFYRTSIFKRINNER